MLATNLIGERVVLSLSGELVATGIIRAFAWVESGVTARLLLEGPGRKVTAWVWSCVDDYSELQIIGTAEDLASTELARAVLAGDKVAARALADRVQELCQE